MLMFKEQTAHNTSSSLNNIQIQVIYKKSSENVNKIMLKQRKLSNVVNHLLMAII